jgi:DNA-binding transcriptional ArsR family regulator
VLRTVSDEELRQLRNLLANIVIGDARDAGMISGVLEMIDGYRAANASVRGENEASDQLNDDLARDIVAELAQHSATTSELAEALGTSPLRVSQALHQLRKLDLVDSTRDLLNEPVRPHRLSLQGRVLADRAGLVSQDDGVSEADELRRRAKYREERAYEKDCGFPAAELGGEEEG